MMNDYGFDYFNYIANVPGSFNFDKKVMPNMMNYIPESMADVNTFQNSEKLVDPREGLVRGNLFDTSYEPYKNYRPLPIKPNGEKEALLYQIMQYKFAIVELNLYLDTHPKDVKMLNLFKKYLEIEKQMCDRYEKMYGPIVLDSIDDVGVSFRWIDSPWPWEVK